MKDFEAKEVLYWFLIKAGFDVSPVARLSHLARKVGNEFPEIAIKVNPVCLPWQRGRALSLAEFIDGNPPKIVPAPKSKESPAIGKKERLAFYYSWEWLKLRKEALNRFGAACQCYGIKAGSPSHTGKARVVVDHIKPISKRWDLRLDPGNLQVLCDECNKGKGAWDDTDHRSVSELLS